MRLPGEHLYQRPSASWQSGHARDCKSRYPGSTPGEASIFRRSNPAPRAVLPSPDDTPRHGGDLAFATARYGLPAGGWLDLSTGVNANPYRTPPLATEALTCLPDRAGLEALLATARSAYRVPAATVIVAVPGTDLALRLLPLIAPPGPVAIVSPTYRSHHEAWTAAGRAVTAIASVDECPADAAVVVLANPNNPDGHVTAPARLVALRENLSARGGLLVVDEAFADVAPQVSLVPHLGNLPALVLRSFGKFYGLPGLRLGFVAGEPAILSRLAALIGDWPVSGPAIAIGTAALADTAWQDETRRRLAASARDLRAVLARHRLAVKGGTDLFVLIDDPRAGDIHARLARHGIWTRVFAENLDGLRLGIPGDAAALARLERALSAPD